MSGAKGKVWPKIPDPDTMHGHAGPYVKGQMSTAPEPHRWEQMHPSMQELLIRMDQEEALAFNRAVKIITSLDQKSLENFKLSLKVFSGLLSVARLVKWLVAAFFTGLGAVSLAGDQLQKIGGQLLQAIKFLRGLLGGGS
jgi:hypothetical protein